MQEFMNLFVFDSVTYTLSPVLVVILGFIFGALLSDCIITKIRYVKMRPLTTLVDAKTGVKYKVLGIYTDPLDTVYVLYNKGTTSSELVTERQFLEMKGK